MVMFLIANIPLQSHHVRLTDRECTIAPLPMKVLNSRPLVFIHFDDSVLTSSTRSATLITRPRENRICTWSVVPLIVNDGDFNSRKILAKYGCSSVSIAGVMNGSRFLVLKTKWIRMDDKD